MSAVYDYTNLRQAISQACSSSSSRQGRRGRSASNGSSVRGLQSRLSQNLRGSCSCSCSLSLLLSLNNCDRVGLAIKQPISAIAKNETVDKNLP